MRCGVSTCRASRVSALRRDRRTVSGQPDHRVDGAPSCRWSPDSRPRSSRFIAGLTLSVERLGARLCGHRADDGGDARASRSSACRPGVAGLAVAADRARRRRPPAARHAGDAGRHGGRRFSPTMTAAVVADSGARGRLSDTVLAMVVLADLVVLVLFSVSMQLARVVFDTGGGGGSANVLARLAWEIGGAVAFGVLIGVLFALYLRYIGARNHAGPAGGVRACSVRSARRNSSQPLLAALAAGVVIENLAVAQGDALRAAVRRGAPPVLVVFFVAVGASLRLDALAAIGLRRGRACRRSGSRSSGSASAPGCTSPASRRDRHVRWTGLVSQAGITLGFASVVATEFPGWGNQRAVLLVALDRDSRAGGTDPVPPRARAGRRDSTRTPARPLIVVSNREPYLHSHESDGRIAVKAATGGVAVALDALMRERGGVWIAHGAGPADRLVVDAADKVLVPPETPVVRASAAVARRADLLRATTAALPTRACGRCAIVVDVRPQFRSEDWAAYQDINARFAAAIRRRDRTRRTRRCSSRTITWRSWRRRCARCGPTAARRSSGTSPGPIPDRLRICPWRRELVAGLLANDLLAFQLERDRRNFLMAAEEEFDAEVEFESSRVRFGGRSPPWSRCRSASTTTASNFAADPALAAGTAAPAASCSACAPTSSGWASIGWTTPRAFQSASTRSTRCMTQRPDLRGKLTFVQIGVPRGPISRATAAIEAEIEPADRRDQRAPRRSGRLTAVSTTTRPRSTLPAWSPSIASRTSASSARCMTG